MKYDVFISYSRKDTAIADQICAAFDKAGISYFIDRQGIGGGMEFPRVLAPAILDSEVFLLLASKNAYESAFTDREVTFAFNNKRGEKMLPYIIDYAPFPKHLELIFASNNWRRLAEHPIETVLIDDVFGLLGRKKAKTESVSHNVDYSEPSLYLNEISVPEKFPEYGFKPTSLMPEQTTNPTSRFYILFGWAFFILLIIPCGIMCFTEKIYSSLVIEIIPIILIIIGYSMRNKPFLAIRLEADYLASKLIAMKPLKDEKHFFVKKRKFGVISIGGGFKNIGQIKILIPAKYDKLSWKIKNKILIAEQNGKSFLIDINGNRLN